MTVRTRFAPSPTGFLHIGGARTALYNWLYARKEGGEFVVRVEDTDAARSTGESLDAILDGMRWLGLEWDAGPGVEGSSTSYFQSQRGAIYESYLEKLEAQDLVYEDEGAIRFRVPDKEIRLDDRVCGTIRVNLREQGSRRWDPDSKEEIQANPDLVIRRPDGSFIFHFVNVVDDIEMGISHVIRGEDHLSNTAKHIALFEAFGASLPVFAHIPLNLNQDGTKMSKRDKGSLIHEYVEDGFLPEAVNNYMALLGWSPGGDREIYLSTEELIADFDLGGVNKSNSKFDYEKCLWVNSEHIRSLSPERFLAVAGPFLEKAGIDPGDERVPAGLDLARERATTLRDVPGVLEPAFADELDYDADAVARVTGIEGIAELVAALIDCLEKTGTWEIDPIKESIKEAAKTREVKMGAFMLPCRVAAMGGTAGADLVPMLVLIGKDRVIDRIRGFAEKYL